MSKNVIQYRVLVEGTEHVVDTMKELSKLVGRKVSRADVNGGLIPEVVGVILPEDTTNLNNPDNLEGEDDMNKMVAKVANDNGGYDELSLHDPLNGGAVVPAVAMDTDTEEDVTPDEAEDITNEQLDEEPLTCGYCKKEIADDEEYVEDEQGTPTCLACAKELGLVADKPEDTTPEDSQEEPPVPDPVPPTNDSKPTMQELLAKMREINAKKKGSEPEDTRKNKRTKSADAQKYIEENNGYPEKGYFKTEAELKKFYKQLSEDQLAEWIELEGLTYKQSDNEPINRMRKCMAIMAYHFTKEPTKANKKKSKYADYKTEDLLAMAIESNIDVPEPKGGDERILRMYTIMALKKAGLLE